VVEDSAWDWVPPVSLAETTGRGAPLPGWWADLGPVARGLLLGLIGLAAVMLLALVWWAAAR
jgi:hypothetical protein